MTTTTTYKDFKYNTKNIRNMFKELLNGHENIVGYIVMNSYFAFDINLMSYEFDTTEENVFETSLHKNKDICMFNISTESISNTSLNNAVKEFCVKYEAYYNSNDRDEFHVIK